MPSEAEASAGTEATITSQIADRPLAKQAAEAQTGDGKAVASSGEENGQSMSKGDASDATEDAPEEREQVAVLTNDDAELDRILMVYPKSAAALRKLKLIMLRAATTRRS